MSEERQDYATQSGTPPWVGIGVAVLAVASIAGVGLGWAATNHAKALEQTINTQQQQNKQDSDVVAQRLSKAEDTNAQLEGELSVVTDKMKLTDTELARARSQTAKIKSDDDKQLADLQNNVTTVNGQLATKASADDVNKLGTDVTGVKADLETTNNNLTMAKGEFGTLVAKNHDEIEELRRMGDRDYYEFTINTKDQKQKVGDMMVELHSVNPKRNVFTVALYVDDARYDKKNRSVNEPIYFFTHGSRAPVEFVVNQVGKDKITGYLSVPKTASAPTQASGN